MSSTVSVTRQRRPILLTGSLVEDAPVVRQILGEPGFSGREVRSVAVSEALTYLQHSAAERPDIILLAVGGPNGDELSTLKDIKEDVQLRTIPVIVLGPPRDAQMVDRSFRLGAAGYMGRSADPHEFAAMIRAVGRYWSLSELPM